MSNLVKVIGLYLVAGVAIEVGMGLGRKLVNKVNKINITENDKGKVIKIYN